MLIKYKSITCLRLKFIGLLCYEKKYNNLVHVQACVDFISVYKNKVLLLNTSNNVCDGFVDYQAITFRSVYFSLFRKSKSSMDLIFEKILGIWLELSFFISESTLEKKIR